jgi:hypothetical protein
VRRYVRAILQYIDVSRDSSLYRSPVDARADAKAVLVISVQLRAESPDRFLVGYSDNASGSDSVDLMRTDRTSFVTLGYAWVR